MIVYNITIKADWSIHREWLQWMQEEYIPEIIATGLFNNYRIMRLLEVDESDGPTYAIQYEARRREDYETYLRQFSEALSRKAFARWGDKFVSFSSVLQIVN